VTVPLLPTRFVFVEGVMGAGKTTTPGFLAGELRRRGHAVAVASARAVPVVAPELLLPLTGWNRHRAAPPNKDGHALRRALPCIGPAQHGWLRAELERLKPGDPWLPRLAWDVRA
jgi:hypothetical protein